MALNDPQWGKRGNQGPPDLDELWRGLQQKLQNLFGGRGGDGQGGEAGSGGPPFKGGIWLVGGLLLLVWLASGFYIVDASQRGVVLRFGKFVETTMPGPRWHLPYPIESVEIVNFSQVRTVEIGYRNDARSKVLRESLMLTDDENIVDMQFAVQYVLKSPEDYLFNVRSPDEAVRQVAETAFREVVGKSRMDFVLYEGRDQLAADAGRLMQEILDRWGTGVSISKVNLQNAQPPEQVQDAFDDAVKAGQDRERLINEGRAYANDVIPRARGTAARMMEEAEGHRQRVVATAEGDASRFTQILTEYQRAPAVTRDRMYVETLQHVLASTSKVVIDKQGSGNLLMLPLDKIIQMTGAAPGAAEMAAKPPTPPEQTPADSAARSREAFRSREREVRP